MENHVEGVKKGTNHHCLTETVPSALNSARKRSNTVTQAKKQVTKLELTEEQTKKLRGKGIWMMSVVLDQTDYSLTHMARMCDISQAWLRVQLKEKRIPATKNKRGHWRVSQATVARIWKKELAKHLDRLTRKEIGKKYAYRRPTEWAVHLVERFLKDTTDVTPSRKKIVRAVMKQAEVVWDANYQARLAKKAANEAEKEKNKKK